MLSEQLAHPLPLPLLLLLLHAPLLRLVALWQREAQGVPPEEEPAESEAAALPLPLPIPLLLVCCSEAVGAPAEAQAVGGTEALSPRDCVPLPLPEASMVNVALPCALTLPALPDPPEPEAWREVLAVALPVVDAEAQGEAVSHKELQSERALDPLKQAVR